MLFSISILSGHCPRLALLETVIHLNFIIAHQGEGYQLAGGGQSPSWSSASYCKHTFFFFFLDCTARYVGSYFLRSNPHPLHWKYSLNHWITREVPIHIILQNHPHFYTFGNAKEFFVGNIFLESMFHLPLTLVMRLNSNCMKI